MKSLKKLLLVLLVAVMAMPLIVSAAEEKQKVTIYMFRGEGCPHCEEALEWFDSLDETTKNKINLVQYETWYNKENSELMKRVATALGEDSKSLGVPYIIIADKTYIGFTETYKEPILAQIKELYGKEDTFDVMQHLEEVKEPEGEKESTTYIVIALIVVAAVVLVYFVSKS